MDLFSGFKSLLSVDTISNKQSKFSSFMILNYLSDTHLKRDMIKSIEF